MTYGIRFGYDSDDKRYFVVSSDIPGLNIEAETYEDFVRAVEDVVPHLVENADGSRIIFEQEIILAA